MPKNSPIIIDSSALVSLLSENDSNHAKALRSSEFNKVQKRTYILPGEIFTEVINVLGKKQGHARALGVSKHLVSSVYTIVETTPQIRKNALKRFDQQPASVSFTDCIVMAIADEFETKEIFGFDLVFAKNGFKNPSSSYPTFTAKSGKEIEK